MKAKFGLRFSTSGRPLQEELLVSPTVDHRLGNGVAKLEKKTTKREVSETSDGPGCCFTSTDIVYSNYQHVLPPGGDLEQQRLFVSQEGQGARRAGLPLQVQHLLIIRSLKRPDYGEEVATL